MQIIHPDRTHTYPALALSEHSTLEQCRSAIIESVGANDDNLARVRNSELAFFSVDSRTIYLPENTPDGGIIEADEHWCGVVLGRAEGMHDRLYWFIYQCPRTHERAYSAAPARSFSDAVNTLAQSVHSGLRFYLDDPQ